MFHYTPEVRQAYMDNTTLIRRRLQSGRQLVESTLTALENWGLVMEPFLAKLSGVILPHSPSLGIVTSEMGLLIPKRGHL